MANFSALKKSSKSQFENLRNKIETQRQGGGQGGADTRFWKPETDKAGNGYAIIRFLQASPGDVEKDGENASAMVQYYRHMFKTPAGKWFVNNCPTTVGGECPVCKANSELWATEIPANQDLVRKRKRQQKYVANILVVKDSANPSNEGKVFLYEFGQKIYKKIESMMFPEFEDETAVDPFSFWDGADFKLKIRQVDGYTNYDRSEFDSPAPISDDDDEIEKIWKQEHSLQEFIDPAQYKSFEKLEGDFNRALGASTEPLRAVDEDGGHSASAGRSAPVAEPAVDDAPFDTGSSEESDESMDYFQSMLDED